MFSLSSVTGWSQDQKDRLLEIENRLEEFSKKEYKLKEQITISLNGTIHEMVSFLAESAEVNLSIASSLEGNVDITFTKATVKDILVYLCDTHELDIKFTGSIIQLIPYKAPPKKSISKEPKITYDDQKKLLSLDLKQDTLAKVTEMISTLTKYNIALDPSIRNKKVDGFVNEKSIASAMAQLAINNNFELEQEEEFFILRPKKEEQPITDKNNNRPGSSNRDRSSNKEDTDDLPYSLDVQKSKGDNKISINAVDAPIEKVIESAAKELNENYYFLPAQEPMAIPYNNTLNNNETNQQRNRNLSNTALNPEEEEQLVSFQLINASFEEVLEKISQNSDFTYSKDAGIYVVGNRKAEGLRETKIIQLKHRSAEGVIDYIPNEITRDVEIDTLMEYNSLILSGSKSNIEEINTFIKSVDKLVPVVMIELIIVDVKTNQLREIGVEAGVVKGGKEPGGTIISPSDSPNNGVNFTFSPTAINTVLDLLSGNGIVNLGQVNADFYLNLRAVEEQGVIEIKSTPRLSTLNSHEAVLSVGQKRYYLEQQVNFPGDDRPIPVQSNRFQEVEANLDIFITPVVSGDEQVTLNIFFEQSEFIGEQVLNAPPPQVSRRFESMIRVKNNEMIVLGGLERESKANLKSGVPFLSRIPILNWIFGKKRKSKSKDKLIIFARPTIIN